MVTEPVLDAQRPESQLQPTSSRVAPHRPFWRRFVRWLLLRERIEKARLQVQALGTERTALMDWSQNGVQVAGYVFESRAPLAGGQGIACALVLYRQAADHALRAIGETTAPDDPSARLQRERQRLITQAGLAPAVLDQLNQGLLSPHPDQLLSLTRAEQEARVKAVRPAVEALVKHARAPVDALQRLVTLAALRLGLALALVVAIALAGTLGMRVALRGPDLARNKPWQASSSYAGFRYDTHSCDGVDTDVFFHTALQDSPWIEYDLGQVMTVRRIEVTNRSDGFRDRAIPLAVELSTDHQTWKEVARRRRVFRTWNRPIEPQPARWVRLRVDRKSYLHLEKVVIR